MLDQLTNPSLNNLFTNTTTICETMKAITVIRSNEIWVHFRNNLIEVSQVRWMSSYQNIIKHIASFISILGRVWYFVIRTINLRTNKYFEGCEGATKSDSTSLLTKHKRAISFIWVTWMKLRDGVPLKLIWTLKIIVINLMVTDHHSLTFSTRCVRLYSKPLIMRENEE